MTMDPERIGSYIQCLNGRAVLIRFPLGVSISRLCKANSGEPELTLFIGWVLNFTTS